MQQKGVMHTPPPAEPAELVSATDIARMLGWPNKKVWSYAVRGIRGFPPAWGAWDGTRLWLRADIERWARETRERILATAPSVGTETEGEER